MIANDNDSRVSEQWSRDAEGRIWYKRIFHKERRVIEYQPADLRLGGVEAHWDRIASVIDPAELQSMSLQPESVAFDGRAASLYRGTREGVQWEVVWLARERLPVRIGIEGSYSLRLLKLEAESANGSSIGCAQGKTQDYESIDFADIGDRQGDPFLEGLMKYEGFSHGHTH